MRPVHRSTRVFSSRLVLPKTSPVVTTFNVPSAISMHLSGSVSPTNCVTVFLRDSLWWDKSLKFDWQRHLTMQVRLRKTLNQNFGPRNIRAITCWKATTSNKERLCRVRRIIRHAQSCCRREMDSIAELACNKQHMLNLDNNGAPKKVLTEPKDPTHNANTGSG